jgi:hypothetical protein
MDAADAARMSDPERNPHFRRRWREAPDERAQDPPAPAETATERLDRLGSLLRAEWLRQGKAAGS